MKVTVRQRNAGEFSVYIPKKDLEAEILFSEKPGIWGGRVELRGGLSLVMPDLPADTKFPITVEARRLESV